MAKSTTEFSSFENQFLVSMPQLDDPNFTKSVILICRHNETGVVGIVINQVSDILMIEIFEQFEIDVSSHIHTRSPILIGGPVQPELGLIVHTNHVENWESSMKIGDDLILTGSKDILPDMAQGAGPEKVVMSLGYAGWAPGQLENEVKENSWFTTPVDYEILFNPDIENKWQQSAKLLGINTSQFSHQVGHA